jgi:autophagy-related protein 9
VKIGDKNLLWFVGVFSAVFAGARSLIPDESAYSKQTPKELIEQVAAHSHYYPDEWLGCEHKMVVRNEVLELFPVKTTLFGLELLSVIMTPIVLCFSMPNCVPNLLEFISKHTVYIEGVGDVCDYACFDFTAYGDMRFGAETEGKSDRPKDGKMEKSCLNFHIAHPQWDANQNGQTFLRRIEVNYMHMC